MDLVARRVTVSTLLSCPHPPGPPPRHPNPPAGPGILVQKVKGGSGNCSRAGGEIPKLPDRRTAKPPKTRVPWNRIETRILDLNLEFSWAIFFDT